MIRDVLGSNPDIWPISQKRKALKWENENDWPEKNKGVACNFLITSHYRLFGRPIIMDTIHNAIFS